MADKSLTDLTATTALVGTDLLFVLDGSNSRKITFANLIASIVTDGSFLETAGGTMAGDIDMDGNAITGNLKAVVTRGAGSDQPTAADSGAWILTDGAITIPNTEGFHCTLEFGGDHDVTHNSITWDTGASAGDTCTVQVKAGNAIRITPIVPAANMITEADFA